MTLHGALSLVLNIRQGMKERLLVLLEQIDRDTENNSLIPFAKLPSIHFARLLICDAATDTKGAPIPDRLAFTTNYDLPEENHIRELVTVAGPGLWQIFSCCEGFEDGAYNTQTLETFINRHNKKAETFYVGVGNRSVLQIRRENQLRNVMELYLDDHRESLAQQPATTIRQQLIDHVMSNPDTAWANIPEPPPGFGWQLTRALKLGLVLIGFIILLPVIVPFVIVWWLIMLSIEIGEEDVPCTIDKNHVRALTEREKGLVQNQFSAVGSVKPGWFRYQTMMFLLRLTDFLAPYLFSKGKLSGIPTVHFARWLIINEGRQMLFLSNYDGNSEGYLRDFIHIAAKQLTLMFTHTIGYPKTRFMIFGGAKDANGFMAWAREKQVVTNVWYSANPGVTVKNIFHNSKIREGLYGAMTEARAQAWLQLF